MAKIIINAFKDYVPELMTKLKATLPGAIDSLIAWLVIQLPASIDKAVDIFRRTYTDIIARTLAWLPTTKQPLVATISKLLDALNTKIIAKL
jgi:hypothetical protein